MSFHLCLQRISVSLSNPAHSKKKVLEALAEMLGKSSGISTRLIFEQLFEREKIGSTALGKGVALPHCRIAGIDEPSMCLLRTQTEIDYGAPDGLPASLFFALLIPEGDNAEYLELVAKLAHKLETPECIDRLKRAVSAAQVIETLKG